jgi:hypothetical protein
VERVAFEAMHGAAVFRVGLRVGLLVGEFGRCELATDMGDGTWKIAVPALRADSDSLDLDRLNESMAGVFAIDAEGCLGQEPGDRERAPGWCSSRKTWVTTTTLVAEDKRILVQPM